MGTTASGTRRQQDLTAALLVPIIAWLSLLGWDTERYRGADGYVHGPYDPWQVTVLCVALLALGAWSGRRRSGLGEPLAAATALAVSFALGPDEDGLVLLGATLVFVATFTGMVTVSEYVKAASRRFGLRSGD